MGNDMICSVCGAFAEDCNGPCGHEALHVFRDDYEYRVARSAADAKAQQMKESGLDEEDVTPEEDWREFPDEMALPYIAEDGSKTVKTCAEWAREHGPGLIGGTEW